MVPHFASTNIGKPGSRIIDKSKRKGTVNDTSRKEVLCDASKLANVCYSVDLILTHPRDDESKQSTFLQCIKAHNLYWKKTKKFFVVLRRVEMN